MNKWIKRIGIVCLIPVLLVLLLSVLLYIPAFQNYALNKATTYASQTTGMNISIDRIRLSFPLNLSVSGVQVFTSPSDTLLSLGNLVVSVKPLPLLRKEVVLSGAELRQAKVNTGGFIDGMTVKGQVERLFIKADLIDLNAEKAILNSVELSDTDLDLLLTEKKEPEDTTSAPLNWIIEIEKALVENTGLSFRIAGDSMRVSSLLAKASLTGGLVDLGKESYGLSRFTLGNSSVNYDADYAIPAEGLDPSHIGLTDIGFTLDSVRYQGKEIKTIIRDFRMKERSGLEILSLDGAIEADTSVINIPQILLKTPYSEARLLGMIPWDAISDSPENNLRALFTAYIGKSDMLLFSGMALSGDFASVFPNRDFELTAGLSGNTKSLTLEQVKAELGGAFRLELSGKMGNLTDSLMRSGDLKFHAVADSINFLRYLLEPGMRNRLHLPSGMELSGTASLRNRAYKADVLFTEDDGRIALDGHYDLKSDAYGVVLKVDSLEPIHFMPQDSLLRLTAYVEAEGKGTDIFSKRTFAELNGTVSDIRYGTTSVTDVVLNGSLKENRFDLDMVSKYPLAEMTLSVSGILEKENLEGMLILDMEKLDLYGFHITERPLATSFQLFSEVRSDFKKDHLLDATLGNWEMRVDSQVYTPKTLTLHVRSNPDTSRVSFHTGDLGMVLTGTSDLLTIKDKLLKAQENVMRQLATDSVINVEVLRPDLPEMLLTVRARRDNPLYNMMQYMNVSFTGLDIDAATSPEEGMRLDAGMYTIVRDSMLLDTVRAKVRQDTLGLIYSADVIKKKYLNQQAFSGGVKGVIRSRYGEAEFHFTDHKGDTGLLLGVRADKVEQGMRMNLYPDNPVLFYQNFSLNENNYILMRSISDIEADLKLTGKENASLWVHSISDGDEMSELHAELSQINLDDLSRGFSFMPAIKGMFSADLQYAPIDSSYMLVADMNVDNLLYEGSRVGEVMFNGVFLPLDETESQIDVHMYRDRAEILNATALYTSGKKDNVVGEINITELPLEMGSPFIPDKMASLKGLINGSVTIEGTSEKPLLNGVIQTDSASVYVTAAASEYRFEDKPITIESNKLRFNKYEIRASGDNPFVLDGEINMADPSKMMADLVLSANNLQLLNVKRNNESIVYGKLFVNMNSTVKGPLDELKMRGNIRVLGNSDVTYVMTESPLTVQDRLDGLVTFVSFSDTLFNKRRRIGGLSGGGGMDVLLTIRIDPAVQMNVDLTPDRSSYVKLRGGGDLAFQYNQLGDMLLNGRYTLSGGDVKYELPIVASKVFTIKDGSYVEWTGELMNPRLNLSAAERVRASVAPEGQSSRSINFDVGIRVEQTLDNMALDFTLDAPEDMTMQNQLVAKGADERRKLAVGLLVTGMYIDKGGSGGGGVNMGSALNSFLQSEINNIAGSALKSVDISFGMEDYDTSEGSRTDYSFRFAKRFYNDRIRIVIGGKISEGANAPKARADNFIDNVSVEYRLDEGGSRYVKLFHNKNYESLLEGEIIETGVGIVLKRKMVRLSELFDFRKSRTTPQKEEEEEK